MFLEQPSDELRQGDICFEWPFPKWQLTEYLVAGDPAGAAPNRALIHLHSSGTTVPITILSHDCDIENPRNRLGLVVAPVLPWPFPDLGSDDSLDLMRSQGLSAENTYDYINLFPIELPDTGADADWRVADFSGLMTMSPPKKVIAILKSAKRYEMTDKTREELKRKLASFFGRP